MNKREKILAGIVGGLVAAFGGQLIVNRARESLQLRRDEATNLQRQINDADTTVTMAVLAKRDLSTAAERSLPSDLPQAQTIYNAYLTELADRHQIKQAKIEYAGVERRPQRIDEPLVMTIFTYRIGGLIELPKLVEMLYEFHSHPYLQQLTLFKVTATPRYGEVSLEATVKVAVLADAPAEGPPPEADRYRILDKPLEDYVASILGRNIFWPANVPPQLTGDTAVAAFIGEPLDHQLSAKDIDTGQAVNYELLETDAPGLKLDGDRLVWQPESPGDFFAEIRVSDEGYPPAASTKRLALKVTERPPAPPPAPTQPEFDKATQTRLTALISGRDGPQAWFTSRLEDRTTVLGVGDKLDMHGIIATVVEIGSSYVELESGERRWTIGQDESLADAYRRGQID